MDRKELDDEVIGLLTKMREQTKALEKRDMTVLERTARNLPLKETVQLMALTIQKMQPAVDSVKTYYENGIKRDILNPDSNDIDCLLEDIRTLNSAIDVIDEFIDLHDCMEKYFQKIYSVKEKSDAFILGRY